MASPPQSSPATDESRMPSPGRHGCVSKSVTELAPATPLVTGTYRVYRPRTTEAAIGWLMQFFGSGLSGVRSIDMYSRDVPLMKNVRFQVPWDLPEGPCLAT